MRTAVFCAALFVGMIAIAYAGPKWTPLLGSDETYNFDRNSVRILPDGSIQIWIMERATSLSADSEFAACQKIRMADQNHVSSSANSLLSLLRESRDADLAEWRKRKTPDDISDKDRQDYASLDQILILNRFDCVRSRIALIQVIKYKTDGSSFGTYESDSARWSNVIPGSVGEAWWEAACKIKKSRLTK